MKKFSDHSGLLYILAIGLWVVVACSLLYYGIDGFIKKKQSSGWPEVNASLTPHEMRVEEHGDESGSGFWYIVDVGVTFYPRVDAPPVRGVISRFEVFTNRIEAEHFIRDSPANRVVRVRYNPALPSQWVISDERQVKFAYFTVLGAIMIACSIIASLLAGKRKSGSS